jgi:pimeloyl-ACP methyl ester carboxylesterase
MFLSYGAVEIAANRDTAFWQEVISYCESDQYKDDDYLVLLKLNNYGHRAGALYPLIEKPESAGYPNFINYSPLTAQSINSLNSVYFQAIFEAAFNDNPVVGKLDKIELPTLLLWGQHDFVCPLALKNDIRNNISSSDVNEYIFSGSAHSPMISEPEAFWTEVINWVNIH